MAWDTLGITDDNVIIRQVPAGYMLWEDEVTFSHCLLAYDVMTMEMLHVREDLDEIWQQTCNTHAGTKRGRGECSPVACVVWGWAVRRARSHNGEDTATD